MRDGILGAEQRRRAREAEELMAHMRRVLVAERDLHDLGLVWRLIESTAAISCPTEAAAILPTLIGTRERFDTLQQQLTAQMADEYRAELAEDLGAKAQCAIDILVRNLFERTADVGFLAIDDSVRAFCAAPPDERAAQHMAMRERLADYQRKYSVYDDVIVCAPDGELLVRLDGAAAPTHSTEPLIAHALGTAGFCERFGASDLAAAGSPAALLYAQRIDDGQGQLLGVLLLRFRFFDEMARVFADVGGERPQLALMLVDAQQRVVASSDEAHVPLGARMVVAASAQSGMQLTQFAGRDYLALHCAGTPYQGYAGPAGWRAVAMVSLLTAFSSRRDADGDAADQEPPLGQGELARIRDKADAITRELRRVVWNGRLMARDQGSDRLRLTAVLRQVSSAGVRTQARVDAAIREIGQTALARGRQRAQEIARLAADILDRNLYERANDCRWWALAPRLREALAGTAPQQQGLSAWLAHINSLYTVYSRLVVFDREGLVCGASGDDGDTLIGQAVPAAMRQAVTALADAERYAVTPFEDSAWHDQGPTYTYLAAVRDPADERLIVGGIAIVFNAAREFRAMLDDIRVGRDGFVAFVDAEGALLCASGEAPAGLLDFEGDNARLTHEGRSLLGARVAGGGYREFRHSDGYEHGIRVVVGLDLGPAERRDSEQAHAELRPLHAPAKQGEALELALFRVGNTCYALPAELTLEAVSQRGLVRTPNGAGSAQLGLLDVPLATGGSQLIHVLCARQLFRIAHAPRGGDGVVLVLRGSQGAAPSLGLLVDEVLAVLDVNPQRLHPAPRSISAFAPWIGGLLECRGEDGGATILVQQLDMRLLLQAAGLLRSAAAAPLLTTD